MTIGIYSLYWEEQDLIYIGKSERIEHRFKEHINKLSKQTHYNHKVQEAYNLYGKPICSIIEECSLKELNDKEISWIKEFNSFSTSNGLNQTEGGSGTGIGTNSSNAKYSKVQILKTFSMLYKDLYSYINISRRTNVSITTINSIAFGYRHIWLKEEYPKQYLLMLNREANKHKVYSNKIETKYCEHCGTEFQPRRNTRYCSNECRTNASIKNKDISKEELELDIWSFPYSSLTNKYNLSAVGIKKRAVALGCIIPPSQYHKRAEKDKLSIRQTLYKTMES